MNPFDAYAKRAATIVNQPARLIGPMKTRAEATEMYHQMVQIVRGAKSRLALESYLASAEPQIIQFRAELPFLWEGDGADFLGLDREIEAAFEQVEALSFFSRSQSDARPGAYPVDKTKDQNNECCC